MCLRCVYFITFNMGGFASEDQDVPAYLHPGGFVQNQRNVCFIIISC